MLRSLMIAALAFVQASPAAAEDISGRMALGVGYPYVSLKYGLTSRLSVEGRGAFGSGIKVFGGRGYYNFTPRKQTVFYSGLEADYIAFDTDGLRGKGMLLMPFVGGEHFVRRSLGVSLDFGGAYIKLADSEAIQGAKTAASGVEWIVNVGINIYFWDRWSE